MLLTMFDRMKELHRASNDNRPELEKYPHAWCFYCCRKFESKKIKEWIDKKQTALCPHCGVDSVLSQTEKVVLNEEIINDMHSFWFGALAKRSL